MHCGKKHLQIYQRDNTNRLQMEQQHQPYKRLGSHTKSQVHKLEIVQHRAARYTCNKYHNTSSVTDMLQTLNWPTVFYRLFTSRHMGDLKTPL